MKANGSTETERLEAIKALLLDDEMLEIERLRKRIRKFEKGGKQRVKSHLSEALKDLSSSDSDEFHQLTEALQPGTEAAIARSVVEDRSRLSRALFPVMGPAIREYVADMFRNLAEDLNETIRNTTSLERIKWRFQARLSGKSYAEFLLLKTANFRVERLLLIDRQSGILIDQVSRDDDAETKEKEGDSNLMSGMLTAIRSFVRDSFADDTDPEKDNELNRFSYGDHQVLIEGGPDMILAAVVEGVAPPTLHEKLSEVLENIHHRKNPWIGKGKSKEPVDEEKQALDRRNLMVPALMENRSASGAESGGMWRFWLFFSVLCVLLGVWFVHCYAKSYSWSRLIEALDKEAGIQVTSHDPWKEIHGLRDPLAEDPSAIGRIFHVDPENVSYQFEPFQSLDAVIVAKRGSTDVSRIQAGLAAAQKELARQEKEFETKLEDINERQQEERLKLVGEIVASRFGHLSSVNWSFEGDTLSVSGRAPYREYAQILGLAELLPSLGNVDTTQLKNENEERIQALKTQLAESPLLYESGAVLPIEAVSGVTRLAGIVRELRNEGDQIGRKFRFLVTAHPLIGERTAANRSLVNARAEAILNRLVLNGIDQTLLEINISEHDDEAGGGVTIVPELISE